MTQKETELFMVQRKTETLWMNELSDTMARARSDIMFRLVEHGANIVSTFAPDAATMKSFIYLVVTTWNATLTDKIERMTFPMLSDPPHDEVALPTPSAAKPKAKRKKAKP